MAIIYPDLENIQRLRVPATAGEWDLINYLATNLDDTYEVFFNPFLDADRPDIIILKKNCAAFIIEVKDWELSHYKVTEANKWEVFSNKSNSRILSPQSQAFRYKKNLYNLHLPVVGLASLSNPNFYNLVFCFVYFYGSSKQQIDSLYHSAIESHHQESYGLNKRFKSGEVDHEIYDKAISHRERKKHILERDRSISFGSDRLANLIKTIKQKQPHILFNEDIYRDFKRRLSPPEHVYRQGIQIKFDEKQLSITKSNVGMEKIKGVAGCGKTTILAQRAINAYERHKNPVLILTFNITLKKYISDKISDIQGSRDFSNFEISNYHQFFNSQLNNLEIDIGSLIEEHGFETLYSVDVFQDKVPTKYQTILVDEIQDYQDEWVKIIRDNFLSNDGEMVLFGDESQNIYGRNVSRSRVIAQGYGRWKKISRSYRINKDSGLNQLYRDFQQEFLVDKYSDTDLFEVSPTQTGFVFSLIKYESIAFNEWKDKVFDSIQNYIKNYDLHPNDVVVLCSKISLIRQLNEFWIDREKTDCMFENFSELAINVGADVDKLKCMNEKELNFLIRQNKDTVEDLRRKKKNHFYPNSGLIKLSTIHSYKGMESKVVFYILTSEDEPEMIYTSITRSSENLVVFDLGGNNISSKFFAKNMN
ncbi:NERD domain-containing protein/DEAD/DEAH box helicase [Methylophaga sp.]|uniref:nuclease-related domain-containing DEAD/DEAH box helicase n=1 Tax=Methylophaga sp. TaxID=2024840 RepID=UPI0025E627DE|nr:NERD domain-containing protein/DEAD/DEAH box helicase [Methylophaga sp.]